MTHKILVIDDEEITLELYKMMLQSLGYQDVTVANRGALGLELMKKHKFDLVFLDLMMPGIYGLDVLRQMKSDKQLKNIPVVLQTGVKSQRDIEEAKVLGVAAVMPKPFNKETLKQITSRVLQKE